MSLRHDPRSPRARTLVAALCAAQALACGPSGAALEGDGGLGGDDAAAVDGAATDALVEPEEHSEEGDGPAVSVEEVRGATVSQTVLRGCSTTLVQGLAAQLVSEVRCLYPTAFRPITGLRNVALGRAVWPYVQAPIADALERVAASARTTITINSALRTLPQQYLLYQWYQQRRCGIVLARPPGVSNHEDGRALDVASAASWRSTLVGAGFHWWGPEDPMHFDIDATGRDLSGAAVRAFQRLWNRNNPTDRIGEDGVYGEATEARLRRAPASGFSRTSGCTALEP